MTCRPVTGSVGYSLRPAKHVERRILCDAFRRRSKFASVESYQYVGFGSVWFSDFSLFHRQLGIGKMISIERNGLARLKSTSN